MPEGIHFKDSRQAGRMSSREAPGPTSKSPASPQSAASQRCSRVVHGLLSIAAARWLRLHSSAAPAPQ